MPTSITSSGITFDDATTLTTGVVPTANIANSAVTAAKLQNGCVVQVVQTVLTTSVSCATLLPADNTIPQNNEGNEILSISITPSSASNKILIRVNVFGTTSGAAHFTAAVFKDSDVNALTTSGGGTYFYDHLAALEYLDTAGTTSAITYKVRAGASANILYINSDYVGTRRYGGTAHTGITLMEIKA